MPLIIDSDLPNADILKKELVPILDIRQAEHQDIRPLQIGILNLMPSAAREKTEIQFLRLLGNGPLQIKPYLLYFDDLSHTRKGKTHLENFYVKIQDIKKIGLDGLIITGANIENIPYENISFWHELSDFFDWIDKFITSTIYCCWAAHAALFYHYRITKIKKQRKQFGVFDHTVNHDLRSPLLFGLDDIIPIIHSRWYEIPTSSIRKSTNLDIAIQSQEIGWHMVMTKDSQKIFLQGHVEYDRLDLAQEYFRDKESQILLPKNYFPDNDETKIPKQLWSANAQVFYSNWINFLYQTTGFDIFKTRM